MWHTKSLKDIIHDMKTSVISTCTTNSTHSNLISLSKNLIRNQPFTLPARLELQMFCYGNISWVAHFFIYSLKMT